MDKIRVRRQNLMGAGRATLARPQRPEGLRSSTVGVVLDSVGTQTIQMNRWIALLHLVGGFLIMTLGLEDVVSGGPTRPMLMPAAGAYMVATVVFFVVMRERSPRVLTWILALSDVALLTAINHLTVLNVVGGPDITAASIASLMAVLYAGYGSTRLSSTLGILLFAAYVTPLMIDTAALDAYVVTSSSTQWSATFLIALAAAIGYGLARQLKIASVTAMLSRLDAISESVVYSKLTRITQDG